MASPHPNGAELPALQIRAVANDHFVRIEFCVQHGGIGLASELDALLVGRNRGLARCVPLREVENHGKNTLREGPAGFEAPSLKHADKFSFAFTKPGEYDYNCTIHPYMKGKIRVYP